MANTIRIKRSTTAASPSSLSAGELAYSQNSQKLWIGRPNDGGAVLAIGGELYVNMLDHTAGTLTASSAIVVDGNSKVNQLKTTNLTIGANAITSGSGDVDIVAAANLDIDAGTIDLSTQATEVSIIDNSTTALVFKEASNPYLTLSTANGVERVTITPATTITGALTLSSTVAVGNYLISGSTISSTNSNGHINLTPNGTGNVIANTDTLTVSGAEDGRVELTLLAGEAAAAQIRFQADEGDDDGDVWTITAGVDDTLKILTDKSGSDVAAVTITNHATIASATTALATGLTVAGATTFSGGVDMGSQATTNVNIDSGVIDGVTLGVNSAITNAQIDNININGNVISSTDSNGHITLTPNGPGNVAVNSDTVSITGAEGESASLFLIADESDDASDDWSITANTNGTLSIGNDIASAGTQVSFLTLTPHATVASSTLAALGNVTIAGNLTVSGTTTSVSTTNTTITDKLVELGNGSSGSASGDVGHVFERGDDANIFVGWDESADTFIAATGSFTGATTGNLTIASYAAAKFGSLTLTTDLAVAEGGTGVSSFTDKGIVYGDGSNALDVTAAPGGADVTTSFQILTAGSGNGNPVWTTTIDGGTY